MNSASNQHHLDFLRQAITLAQDADRLGNLPIGAVIVLEGEVVARGKNAIWKPLMALTRHAEMEALHALPDTLLARCSEMTLYTTLEPCVMCTGAILLHGISQVFYGSADPFGGIGISAASLPPFFREQLARTRWEGPLLPAECDPLYARIQELEGFQS